MGVPGRVTHARAREIAKGIRDEQKKVSWFPHW